MTIPLNANPAAATTTARAATPRTSGPSKPGLRPPGTRPTPPRSQSQNAFAQALAQAQGSRTLGTTGAAPANTARTVLAMQPSNPIDLQVLGLPLAQTAPAPAQAAPVVEVPGGFGPIIQQAALKYGVDPALVAAVMETESRFNPDALSRAGAQGLMQLMPGTARGLGVTNASDPLQNILGGTKLLGQLIEKYGGNVEFALAAYNAGSGAVDKYGGIPPYGETQKYVPLVMSAYERFKAQFGGPASATTQPAAPVGRR